MKTIAPPAPAGRNATINIRVPAELKRRVGLLAEMRDVDISDIVREALREKLNRAEAHHLAAA